jgi:hypothetical protein
MRMGTGILIYNDVHQKKKKCQERREKARASH